MSAYTVLDYILNHIWRQISKIEYINCLLIFDVLYSTIM